MQSDSKMESASLNPRAFQAWTSTASEEVSSVVNLSRPSLKALVALVLSGSKGRFFTYEELTQAIRSKGLFEGGVPESVVDRFLYKEGLRVAVSALAQQLKLRAKGLRIESTKVGREARIAWVGTLSEEMESSAKPRASAPWGFRRLDTDLIVPQEIARAMLRDGGGLPFASAYASYRSAAKWLSFSSAYSRKKIEYEAGAFCAYDLDKLCFDGSKNLTFFGLATGEGLGEVELLERLLPMAQARGVVVDYLGIDTSDFLLASHAQLVQQRFSKEIQAGLLRLQFAVGNVYELKRILKEIQNDATDFGMAGPVLCTFLGNCLGNYEYHEWDFFRSILESVAKSRTLVSLVGVSVERCANGKPVQEKYTLDPFWLETPRHLLHELRVLRSFDKTGIEISPSENDEFLPSAESATSYIPFSLYQTAFGIRGVVYRFYYTLKHDLRTADGTEEMARGQSIHLYSIVKYNLASLTDSISKRNILVKQPGKRYPNLVIRSGKEEFHYAVFSAIRRGQVEKQ